MAKILGLGGVFIRSPDQKRLIDWYTEMFGLDFEEFGAVVMKHTEEFVTTSSYSIFSVSSEDTDYFEPGGENYMINFVVDDVRAVVENIRGKGAEILMEPRVLEQGIFAWVKDPDGRKIELYQPPE